MSLEFTAALTAAVEADLSEAATKFPSASLTWKWHAAGEAAIRFFAEFNDSPREMELVIHVGLGAGPALDYTTATCWLQDVSAVSVTQTVTNVVELPAPTAAERATFVSMTQVLAYVAAWRDRLSGP